jgi:hypothetical protein
VPLNPWSERSLFIYDGKIEAAGFGAGGVEGSVRGLVPKISRAAVATRSLVGGLSKPKITTESCFYGRSNLTVDIQVSLLMMTRKALFFQLYTGILLLMMTRKALCFQLYNQLPAP